MFSGANGLDFKVLRLQSAGQKQKGIDLDCKRLGILMPEQFLEMRMANGQFAKDALPLTFISKPLEST